MRDRGAPMRHALCLLYGVMHDRWAGALLDSGWLFACCLLAAFSINITRMQEIRQACPSSGKGHITQTQHCGSRALDSIFHTYSFVLQSTVPIRDQKQLS